MAVNEAVRGRSARRGMYVLPSLFTAGNIAAGFYAMLQSVLGASGNGDAHAFDRAAIAIAFAALFDGLDGRVARMTGTASDFGREFDSLADVITFGVAPALLAYMWGISLLPHTIRAEWVDELQHLGIGISFVFLICGACRLARFNIAVNPQPRNPGRPDKKYFVGMPIPAGAGVLAAVIHFEHGQPIDTAWACGLWLALIAATSFLMVSSWRFWSAKELNISGEKPMRGVLIVAVTVALIFWYSRFALMALALAYLVSGVVARIAYGWGRPSTKSAR